MATDSVLPAPEILNSWKEIARYLDRGMRTVQRWEIESGLPVRRPRPNGQGRSAVFAFRSELDAWLRSCQIETPGPAVLRISVTPVLRKGRHHARRRKLSVMTGKLILDSRRLQQTAMDSQAKLIEVIVRLRDTVNRMVAGSPAEAPALLLPETDSLILAEAATTTLNGAKRNGGRQSQV